MRIRRATEEDWPTARALRLAALADAPDAFGSTLDDARERPESWWRSWAAGRFVPGDAAMFLATPDEGDAVGIVVGARLDESDEGERPDQVQIWSMWVAPAARGRGVGLALIEVVADWARTLPGTRELVLHVTEGNMAAEITYARAGFAVDASAPEEALRPGSALRMRTMRRALRPVRESTRSLRSSPRPSDGPGRGGDGVGGDGGLPASLAFDRAAEDYDRTRAVGEQATADTIAHLIGAFGRLDAPVLEIGVGTGILAIPVAERGVRVVGVDLAPAMLAKLREKDAGGRVTTLEADARRLPFVDAAFGGAYLRHVLHLIPDWQTAVADLCRVVRPGGRILVDAGRSSPEWRAFWRVIAPILGPLGERPGLDLARDGERALDAAFSEAGARRVGVERFAYPDHETWGGVLDAFARRSSSFTWRVPDEAIDRAIEAGARWVEDHGGRGAHVTRAFRVTWFAFEVAR